MKNDKAVKEQKSVATQKVFVRLADVLEVQEQYLRAAQYKKETEGKPDTVKIGANARLQTIEQVLRTLQIPIPSLR